MGGKFTFKQSVYYNLLFALLNKGMEAKQAHATAMEVANDACTLR